jgi:hypothetical protein
MARPEDTTLAAIDDGLAALSGVFESVAIVIARQRVNLTRRDVQELERIVEAASTARRGLLAARQEKQTR